MVGMISIRSGIMIHATQKTTELRNKLAIAVIVECTYLLPDDM